MKKASSGHEKQRVNLVWLKRDLRTSDHEPLFLAEKSGLPYLVLFLFEPSLCQRPDTSLRHLQFQYFSLQQMNQVLDSHKAEICISYTEANDFFKWITQHYAIDTVFSYRESGTLQSYQRDIQIQKFFNQNSIVWKECQRDGILRGLKNRKNWDELWVEVMSQKCFSNTFHNIQSLRIEHPFTIPDELLKSIRNYPSSFQPAGEEFALKYLVGFLKKRGINYSKNISKPELSRRSCSRLSPYLSWGNISIRQVYQNTMAEMSQQEFKRPFLNFISRLHWHCHFIQKFEMECAYENVCINKGYENMHWTKNEYFIKAWQEGRTGVPIVDACMRCLHETGWINFRMRALLVSFLCHHLFQDWREGSYHLARLFLDYEPGIHFPQMQMQAGTTGVNLIRLYNPVKNSLQHDTDGIFIKKWIPELKNLPNPFVHQPWLLNEMEQSLYDFKYGIDYPKLIVDLNCAKENVRQLWEFRKNKEVIEENKRILKVHVNS